MSEKDQLQEAIERIREDPRDQDAWASFYRSLRPRLAGVLYRTGVVNKEEIRELCQAVFARFFEYSPWRASWKELPDAHQLVAYLAVVARNLARSVYKSAKQLTVGELDPSMVEARADVEEVVISKDGFRRLYRALNNDEFDLLLLLAEGYRLPEIANLMEISYSNAGVKVHRLREKVRELLTEK